MPFHRSSGPGVETGFFVWCVNRCSTRGLVGAGVARSGIRRHRRPPASAAEAAGRDEFLVLGTAAQSARAVLTALGCRLRGRGTGSRAIEQQGTPHGPPDRRSLISRGSRGKIHLNLTGRARGDVAKGIEPARCSNSVNTLGTDVPTKGHVGQIRAAGTGSSFNLLTNGAKYTPPGGQIVRGTGSRAETGVRDGTSIEAEMLPSISPVHAGAPGDRPHARDFGLGPRCPVCQAPAAAPSPRSGRARGSS